MKNSDQTGIVSQVCKSGEIWLWSQGALIKTGRYVSEARKTYLNAIRKEHRLSSQRNLVSRMKRLGGDIPEGLNYIK